MKKIFLFFYVLFLSPVFADDCVSYKIKPSVILKSPEINKVINQSDITKDKMHGSVEASLISNYSLLVDVYPVKDGFCVSLKQIDATIGFENFYIQIDYSHKPNSCSYNAVLAHEEKHIKTYLDIIDEFQSEIKNSLIYAADSVMPVYISDKLNVDSAVDLINEKFSSHPDLLLVSQKINAAQEIRNKQIDQNENNSDLYSCYNQNTNI